MTTKRFLSVLLALPALVCVSGPQSLAALTTTTPSSSLNGDIYEPDDAWWQASPIKSDVLQTHSIYPVGDTDWATFTLTAHSGVLLETAGASGDTRLWLYTSAFALVEFDDDDGLGLFSRIDRRSPSTRLPPGTYYVKVDEYDNDDVITEYHLNLTIQAPGDDVLVRDPTTGQLRIWYVRGGDWLDTGSPATVDPSTGWVLQGVGDFNNDLTQDLLWRHALTNDVAVWLMRNGALWRTSILAAPPSVWSIEDVGDFNGDGCDDILWRNTATQEIAVWLVSGTRMLGGRLVGVVDSTWQVAGVGDLNGDSTDDVVWRQTSTGATAAWLMRQARLYGAGVVGTPPLTWAIRGVGDLDGDGKADILWRNTSTGEVAGWLMNGLHLRAGGVFSTVPAEWSVAALGDFDQDGRMDILWRNSTTDQLAVWLMNGLSLRVGSILGTISDNWDVEGTGDFNPF